VGTAQAKAEHKKVPGQINAEKVRQTSRANTAEAPREATKETVNFQHSIDKKKCSAMSDNGQGKCISDARAKYGK